MSNPPLAQKSKMSNYREKVRGNFKLRMSPNLSRPQKISKYAQEPFAFHIYKNRRFFNKIELPRTIEVKMNNVHNLQNQKIRKIRLKNKSRNMHNKYENLNQTYDANPYSNDFNNIKPSLESPYLNSDSLISLEVGGSITNNEESNQNFLELPKNFYSSKNKKKSVSVIKGLASSVSPKSRNFKYILNPKIGHLRNSKMQQINERSSSTQIFRHELDNISKEWDKFKSEVTSSELGYKFRSHDREREWIKSLMNTLQEISSGDPLSIKLLYDIKRDEMKNVGEAKNEYKKGVADPIRWYNIQFH